MSKAMRLFNTIRYLKPSQLFYQVRDRVTPAKATAPVSLGGRTVNKKMTLIPPLDLDANYLNRFDTAQIQRGEITLINESHHSDGWNVAEASHLWNFNLHYMEFCIPLAAIFYRSGDIGYYSSFKSVVTSWIEHNPIGVGDGWHPYTISMRIPNLLICCDLFGNVLQEDTIFSQQLFESIYNQYLILKKHLELKQLGNHYFENLKTLVLCSILFDDGVAYNKLVLKFKRELNEEILPDGVHFELSIMYHKIILEDVMRVAYWLWQTGKQDYFDLLPTIERMVSALASLERGLGKTPLFNDAGDGIAKDSASLLAAAHELFEILPKHKEAFPDSGYYKLYDGELALMFDAGEIGPRYMPGHGHCDCLSFELSVKGVPLIINSGTYQYQGELRSYFRSTEAHNTVTIGGKQQSECWGEHRVARRIANVTAVKSGNMVTGSYRSYFGDCHTRKVSLEDRVLTVTDRLESKRAEPVSSFLHLAPGYEVREEDEKIEVSKNQNKICVITSNSCTFKIHHDGRLTNYSPEFGCLKKGTTIEFSWQADDEAHGYELNYSE